MRDTSGPIPIARVHRDREGRTNLHLAEDAARGLSRLASGIRTTLGILGAFAPLVAVIALALSLLYAAGMSGSP